jgi:hypothetical protein
MVGIVIVLAQADAHRLHAKALLDQREDVANGFGSSRWTVQQRQHVPRELLLALNPSALGDIADIALNHLSSILDVNVADELHFSALSVLGFQRQVLIADILSALQVRESGLRRGNVP